jgi:hypothetical protein
LATADGAAAAWYGCRRLDALTEVHAASAVTPDSSATSGANLPVPLLFQATDPR